MKKIFFSSIQTKILSLILIILITTIVIVVYFVYTSQRSSLISTMNRGIYLNTETLVTALQTMMLDGKAPLLVKTMTELKGVSDYKEIAIYRTNGMRAFSDFTTLENVNLHQTNYTFIQTPRIPDERTENEKTDVTANIKSILLNQVPISKFINATKEIEYYTLIENKTDCMQCHSSEFPYRGIIHFKLSIAGTYAQIDKTRNFLLIFFIFVGIILGMSLIILLRTFILLPVFRIRDAVKQLGTGDFKARVELKSGDELGELAGEINKMIKGLEERFKLSKYVSSSTRSIVASDETAEETKKVNVTVLFSDVRGFTSYSESHPPEVVIENLNRILEIQAEIIEKEGGDIDKFVGDEIMAVFNNEYSAILCAERMIKAVIESDRHFNAGLRIGIGINSGEVVAGHIGSRNRREYAIIGDTVNVASRLCSLAQPDTVLLSEITYKKTMDKVKAELLKGQKIKGKKELIDVYILKSVSV